MIRHCLVFTQKETCWNGGWGGPQYYIYSDYNRQINMAGPNKSHQIRIIFCKNHLMKKKKFSKNAGPYNIICNFVLIALERVHFIENQCRLSTSQGGTCIATQFPRSIYMLT